MFNRYARSLQLAGQCWNVLVDDPALLVFPLLSLASLIVLLASFALPSIGVLQAFVSGSQAPGRIAYATLFLFYLGNYFIVTFFNTALCAVALRRLGGENMSVGDGLRLAASRAAVIFGYALIAAGVGTLLRHIEERVGFIGRLVVGLLGFSWSLVTALVVPVLAAEDIGPIEAIRTSAQLLRRTWGENLLGNSSIGLVAGLALLAVAVLGAALASIGFQAHSLGLIMFSVAATALFLLGVVLVWSTLHAIYAAALFRFARGDGPSGGIDAALLQGAYGPRRL